jgi:hypothetical protein
LDSSLPTETWNVIRAGDFTISTSNTYFGIPGDDAGLGVFSQALEHTARNTSRIDAVHALLLDVSVGLSVRRLVQLDDVLGGGIQFEVGMVNAFDARVSKVLLASTQAATHDWHPTHFVLS